MTQILFPPTEHFYTVAQMIADLKAKRLGAKVHTYGYIRSHMRNHQRITTLVTLRPGDDFADGMPCDSQVDAQPQADRLGVVLVTSGVLSDMVDERRLGKAATHDPISGRPVANANANGFGLLVKAEAQEVIILPPQPPAPTPFPVGTRVMILPWNKQGTVVELTAQRIRVEWDEPTLGGVRRGWLFPEYLKAVQEKQTAASA